MCKIKLFHHSKNQVYLLSVKSSVLSSVLKTLHINTYYNNVYLGYLESIFNAQISYNHYHMHSAKEKYTLIHLSVFSSVLDQYRPIDRIHSTALDLRENTHKPTAVHIK